jgi:hypothetical protein
MPSGIRIDRKQLEQALRANYGNVSVAAQKMGIDRTTVYNYVKRYPSVGKIIDDAREHLVDLAEASIGKMITEGNPAAVIFTLKTQGRGRGWIERMELEHSGDQDKPIAIVVKHVRDNAAGTTPGATDDQG